jgi:hypothetical protein
MAPPLGASVLISTEFGTAEASQSIHTAYEVRVRATSAHASLHTKLFFLDGFLALYAFMPFLDA